MQKRILTIIKLCGKICNAKARNTKKMTLQKISEKNKKSFKKGIDKCERLWYNM